MAAAYRKSTAYRNSSTYPGGDAAPPAAAESGRVVFAIAATSSVRASASAPGARVTFNEPQRPRVTGG